MSIWKDNILAGFKCTMYIEYKHIKWNWPEDDSLLRYLLNRALDSYYQGDDGLRWQRHLQVLPQCDPEIRNQPERTGSTDDGGLSAASGDEGDLLYSGSGLLSPLIWHSSLKNNMVSICFLINCQIAVTFSIVSLSFILHLYIIIPHATSCGGYNVFDPSVSQSVSQSVSPSVLFFSLAQLLWNRSTEFRETL